jgi:hypothetical protein
MHTLLTVAAWLAAHEHALVATAALVVAALRAVPAPQWQRLERDWPRAANLARALRACGPDLWKTGKALAAVWTGRPWGPPATPVVVEPRAGESPR